MLILISRSVNPYLKGFRTKSEKCKAIICLRRRNQCSYTVDGITFPHGKRSPRTSGANLPVDSSLITDMSGLRATYRNVIPNVDIRFYTSLFNRQFSKAAAHILSSSDEKTYKFRTQMDIILVWGLQISADKY